MIAVAQFFAMFPIIGIFSKNYENIKFKLLSIRTLHSLLWLISVMLFLYFEINRVKHQLTLNAKTIGGLVFFCYGITTSIFFLQISLNWNNILQKFKDVEEIFLNPPYSLAGWTLKKRIHVTAATFLSFALCEHLLSCCSHFHDRILQAKICKWEIGSWFYYITSTHLPHLYSGPSGKVPVIAPFVIWGEYINVSLTFSWNFVDLFIMLMSLSISTKFKMINERLKYFKGRVVTDVFWEEIRCHYNKICELNEFIDDALGNLICMACLSDLYYVCLQLLHVAT